MKKILPLFAAILCLSSCGIIPIHKMDVEQGNVMTPEMTSQLHPGMSVESVKAIMGTPMLTNTFSGDRVDYVYTNKPGRGDFQEQYVTLIFKNGKLKDIQGNRYSQVMR